MLKSQEIMLAQSKRRERMAEIQKADEVGDEGRTELRSLSDAYSGAEIEYRAALIVEGAEREAIKETDKAADSFAVECRAFNLSAVVGAITDGKAITGREAEISAELEKRNGGAQKGGVVIPFEAMAPLETRADAEITTTPASGGNLASRPVMSALERLFAGSAAEAFGFRTVAVQGKPIWPEMTAGASAHWVAEGQGVDAESITTTTRTPAIKTATARYLLSRQAIKENPALESVLRRDLAEVMREAVDKAAFQGTGANGQPLGLAGLLAAANRTTDVGAPPHFSTLLAAAVSVMESAKLADLGKIKIGAAPILLETLANSMVGSTAVSDLDRLQTTLGKPVFSSQISPTAARDATGKGESTVFVGAPDGLALIPTWGNGAELIVDPYSESKTGRVSLTIFTFVDVLVQRLGTHFLALSGVQDRI